MTSPTNFAEAMANNPPRLVVMFRHGEDGSEQFQWGVVGSIPVLTLIGAITRVQAELPLLEPGDLRRDTRESALVMAWDPATRIIDWFVHPDIPVDPLVGILETLKSALVDSRLAQQAAAQRTSIVGPDGKPIKY